MKRTLMICVFVSGALVVAACGGRQEAGAADEAGSPATAAAPTFTEVSLADVRAAGGPSLQQTLDFAQEECGARPLGFEEGGLTSADLNADGRADYVIDMSFVTCGGENSAHGWCGSGGCSIDVAVSRGEDYLIESLLGMEPGIVRVADGLGVAAMGREGPWTLAWNGQRLAPVDAAGAPQSEAAASREEAAVRAVVASIYDTYVAGYESGAMIPEGVETADLRAIIDSAADPEIGGLGFDYYCACQDYGDVSYDMSAVSVSGDRARVAVDLRSFGSLTQIELRLRKVGGRWQVDDVIDPNGSLREQLAG